MSERCPEVALVSMPFGNVLSPSMGLSLLKGGLSREGISCRVHYFCLRFLRLTGLPFYSSIANDINPTIRELAGEWLFTDALFGDRATDPDRYVDEVLGRRNGWITTDGVRPITRALLRRLLEARTQVDGFLDECAEQLLREQPRLVGFTSVFQQHVASLALARRLRAASPDLVIVMGGANCEGVMGAETMRRFPFLNAVVSGEADLVFPEVARRAIGRASLEGLPGVKTPAAAAEEFRTGTFGQAPPVRDMDALPYPDFSDFFEQFNATRYRLHWQPRIFFETSRGCWWGEKQHCTFCGLNGMTMTFRSKTSARALEELETLGKRHPGCDIQVVDNILDMKYFKDFLPALAERRLGLELFYETKSNLRKDHLRLLKDAGVGDIQPGVESLSDEVLRLMRKGVTGLQNVQLLKWCTELGITPHWNVLWGFPGEPPEEYARMASLMPLLTHLAPPIGFGGIRLDRFSPNFFESGRLGFTAVEPLRAYHYVYPLPPEAVANLAYHFTFRYQEPRDVSTYIRPLLKELQAWQTGSSESVLFFADTGDELVVCDSRPVARALVTRLDGIDRVLYLACDAIADLAGLVDAAAVFGESAAAIEARLSRMAAGGLMLQQGTRFLALAIPLGAYAPPAGVVRRLYKAGALRGCTRSPRRLTAECFSEPPSGDTLVVRNTRGPGVARTRSR